MKPLMKVSEFFKNEISPFVLGAYFSRYIFVDNDNYIVSLTNFKKSKLDSDFSIDEYIPEYVENLNKESNLNPYWYEKKDLEDKINLPRGQSFFVLENDMQVNSNSFFNKLYAKILSQCDWVYDDNLNEQKKSFIRGYMELRGSIDTTADFIAQDYFYKSSFEIKKARLLVDYMSVPYYVVNINFRELQKQYYENTNKRNTQLRLKLSWYMENIGMINKSKIRIFMISRKIKEYRKKDYLYFFNCYNPRPSNNNLLDERLNFYSTNIFDKNINDNDIKQMRESLGFDGPAKSIRNMALVELIKYLTPDECMGCKNEYDIKDRTFINKKTGRPYFEVHHMISLGNNKELDDENNMVKLCPICHKTLKKGVSTPEEQKKLISEIYHNAPNVLDFAQHFFDTNDFGKIVELTFNNLK